MESILNAIAPAVAVLLAGVAPVIAGLLVTGLTRWMNKMGVDIDAKNRDALQSALTNAALVAVAKQNGRDGPAAAIEYVRQSVPGAINRFGLDDVRIGELLIPKIVEAKILAGKSPV